MDAEGRTQSAGNAGADLERRVARLEFAEGAFARLRVPVKVAADPGRSILTDLDVLAMDIDNRLRVSRSILECKTTKGQSGEPDRLLWLAGLQRFTRTDRAVLVRQTITKRGRAIAATLGLQILDIPTLAARETSHAWVPTHFAHIDGPGCIAAEARTDTQLKGLGRIPGALVGFLRHDFLLADSPACLNALESLGNVVNNSGILPQPTSMVLASHALIVLILAALHDAARLDIMPKDELHARVERGLTLGDPDNDHVLSVLAQADELVHYMVDRVHEGYVTAGATRQRTNLASLKELVNDPPVWVPRYVDLAERLRANPSIASTLMQTAELACFDALCGDNTYTANAFDHLFTREHQYLLVAAVKCLQEIIGYQLTDAIQSIDNLDFNRTAPVLPDRAGHVTGGNDAPSVAERARQPTLPGS
jgi:hypothetical protein